MSSQITQILNRIADGQANSIEELIPLVYDQMRTIAASALRREPDKQCDPTELVHEAYIRLIGNEQLAWQSRSHFFGACSMIIRRILVDEARARKSLKRGGEATHLSLDQFDPISKSNVDLIELDDALNQLETLSPRQVKVIELRYFGGLTEHEVAELLNVSRRTVAGDWAMARAWLRQAMSD